jgi:divalent metal cation (Fe/Co/Zn/Cd) transporter
MDAVDPALVDRATEALVAVEVRELRRWIGHRLRAEADITADPSLTITRGHQLAHQAEDRLLARVCRLSAASAHVSPIEAHQEIEPPRSLSSDA